MARRIPFNTEPVPEAAVAQSVLGGRAEAVLLVEPVSWRVVADSRATGAQGRGAEQTVGLTLSEALSGLPGEALLETIADVVRTGAHQRLEDVAAASAEAEPARWELSFEPLRTADGNVTVVVVTVARVDSAPRRRDELEAAVSRGAQRVAELAQIINGFPDGVLLVDSRGDALYANARLDRLFGLERGVLRARTYPDIVARLDCRGADGRALGLDEHPIARALRGEPVVDEIMLVGGVNAAQHLSACAAPLETEDGAVTGAVFVVRDVSDWVLGQSRLEEALATERRRASQLRLFNQLMMAVSSEADEGRLLDDVLHGAMRLTGALEGFVYLFEYSSLRLEAFCSTARWAPGAAAPEARELMAEALAEEVCLRGPGPRSQTQHLAAPLRAGDGARLGCLLLSSTTTDAGFSADDEVFVSNLAAHVSVALQNLRRIAHEREVALYLQRSMLPRIVQVPGLESHFTYRSAADVALVGGDFYDLIPLANGQVAVVVGDVCGKGLAAATQTAKARYIFRAYATFGYGPGRWLLAAHEALHGNLDVNEFVTAVLVILDPETGELEYALAGHPPPLVTGPDGVRELCGEPGLPLGASAQGIYKSHEDRLGLGESLVLYTDGLFEARRGRHLFGVERLSEAVARLLVPPLAQGTRALVEEARQYAGGRLADDVVVGVIRRGDSSRGS